MFPFITIQLKEHYNSDCTRYVRECSFKDLGCSAKVLYFCYMPSKIMVLL